MSTGTGIEWTQATWNPVSGCTRASAGCDHCYSVTMTNRLAGMGQAKYAGLTVVNPKGDRHFNGVVRTHDDALEVPLRWKKPRRIFVNSMSDLFHKDVPFEFIDKVFAVMALCPQHTFQVLTKRPERMAEYLNYDDRDVMIQDAIDNWLGRDIPLDSWPISNIWLGTSTEDQAAADLRIPHMLRCPAAVRFISAEPLLGPIELGQLPSTKWPPIDALHGTIGSDCQIDRHERLHWVIVGGESGKGARPCNVAWVRSIVEQCKAAGVACFVKQLGARPYLGNAAGEAMVDPTWPVVVKRDSKGSDMAQWPEDLRVREFPIESERAS